MAVVLSPACALWPPRSVDTLWIPDGTIIKPDVLEPLFNINGRAVYRDGSISAGFTATISRDEVTRDIAGQLEVLGWRQRTTQYLNPTMPTSFDAGWEHHCACLRQFGPDGRPLPQTHIETWRGEWENSLGDVMTYSLTSLDSRIDGSVTYIPARIVQVGMRRTQGSKR